MPQQRSPENKIFRICVSNKRSILISLLSILMLFIILSDLILVANVSKAKIINALLQVEKIYLSNGYLIL